MIFGIPLWAILVAAIIAGGGLILLGHAGRDGDSEPEATTPGEETGKAAANATAGVFGALWTPVGMFISQLAYIVSRFVPVLGRKWWAGVAKFSLQMYHKRAGGDAVALVGSETTPTAEIDAAKFFDGLDDLDDKPGWRLKGRDRTFADSHHGGVFRIGKTPVLLVNRDERRVGSWLEANVTEAIDGGNMHKLYDVEGADLQADITVETTGGGGSPAVTDGGHNDAQWWRQAFNFAPRESPVFKDKLIDLTSSDDYDGRVISWWKYADHDPTTTTPEAIDQAEERGRLAGLAGEDFQKKMMRLFIYAGLIIVGAIAAMKLPAILRLLMGGGGGGGGGGVIPFMLDVAVTAFPG